tara:strand:- start:760 stop:1632 length:873 start_codon:yes stop_codon:yes gene_type:complete
MDQVIDYEDLFKKQLDELHAERCKNKYLASMLKYLASMLNVLNSNKNIGEKDELVAILQLYHLDTTQQYSKLVSIFGDAASAGIEVIDLGTKEQIMIDNIKKAHPGSKSDIAIKMRKDCTEYNVSIKSKNGANPSLLNHTPRTANVFRETGVLYTQLRSIDALLHEYINKRNSKLTKEDIRLVDFECIQDPEVHADIIDLLVYFVFDGTGKGYSKNKANSILLYNHSEFYFHKCLTKEEKTAYIVSILDKCVLSLREKGMPKVSTSDCAPWIYHDLDSGSQKGSLHIRMK